MKESNKKVEEKEEAIVPVSYMGGAQETGGRS